LPASTSRAPAGSGVLANSAPNAVPTTSSLLWLATARDAVVVAAAALSADTAWTVVERVPQEFGSRREGRRSGEKTQEDEDAMATASCLVRAGGTGRRPLLSRQLGYLARRGRTCVRVRERSPGRG
jgi:hypothetical protein